MAKDVWREFYSMEHQNMGVTEPFAERTDNPGHDSRWTCPGCYEDILSSKPGTFQCKGCGRKVDCTLEYQPVCVAILDEGSQDAQFTELRS